MTGSEEEGDLGPAAMLGVEETGFAEVDDRSLLADGLRALDAARAPDRRAPVRRPAHPVADRRRRSGSRRCTSRASCGRRSRRCAPRSRAEEPMTDERVSFSLSFPARAEYLVLCRLAVTALAGLAPLDEELVDDLKLAVTEACTNTIQHAYRDGEPGRVELQLRGGGRARADHDRGLRRRARRRAPGRPAASARAEWASRSSARSSTSSSWSRGPAAAARGSRWPRGSESARPASAASRVSKIRKARSSSVISKIFRIDG